MRLFLVRHARTKNNVNHVAQGHLDSDLDEVGIEQADELADFLEDQRLERLFSSDSKRCVQTAAATVRKTGLDLIQTPLLRERFLGELEGAPITKLRKAFDTEVERTGESRFKVKPCGCESAYEVMDRAQLALELILQSRESAAVFTHGMMKEVLLCALIGAPVECSRSFRFDNAAVTELRWSKNVWVLERFNQVFED
jgi:broad specificity phosphatase PhoE